MFLGVTYGRRNSLKTFCVLGGEVKEKAKVEYVLTCSGGDSSIHNSLKEAFDVGLDCPDLKTHEIYRRTSQRIARYCRHKKCWEKK